MGGSGVGCGHRIGARVMADVLYAAMIPYSVTLWVDWVGRGDDQESIDLFVREVSVFNGIHFSTCGAKFFVHSEQLSEL